MSSGAVVIIVVAVIVVAAAAGWALTVARRRRLQRKFGPEYDRVASEQPSRLKADHELAARERRVRSLNIRPLEPAARAEYATRWSALQERFVDDPGAAVAEAQNLVVAVMRDRGYPTDDQDQLSEDLSVEHANTLLNYRQARDISDKSAAGNATTEDLRQAMIHYRLLFSDLLGEPAGVGTGPDATAGTVAGTGTSAAGGPAAAAELRPGTGPAAGVSAGPAAARNTAVSGDEADGQAASTVESERAADRGMAGGVGPAPARNTATHTGTPVSADAGDGYAREDYPDGDYPEPAAADGEPLQRGRRR